MSAYCVFNKAFDYVDHVFVINEFYPLYIDSNMISWVVPYVDRSRLVVQARWPKVIRTHNKPISCTEIGIWYFILSILFLIAAHLEKSVI